MELDTLRLVVALADRGDLARAAQDAGISGKRVAANRIAALERRIGAILFDHSGPKVRPTEAGHAFIGEARLALAASERAERLARAVAQRPQALPIGVVASALFGPVRDLIEAPAFVEAGFAPVLHEMRADEQLQALADGQLTMGFLTPPFAAPPRLEHTIVHRSRWVAALPAQDGHLRKSATLAGLARKPLVMIARDQAMLIHDALIGTLAGTGATPRVVQEAHQWPSLLAMVALGLGAALVPSVIATRLKVEGVTFLPLTDGADLTPWPTACAWLPQPAGSRAAEAIAIMKATFKG